MTLRRGVTLVTLLTLAAAAAGCSGDLAPPRAQWKVMIATDAAIPQVGQVLLVELIDDAGAATSASAQRVIDASSPSRWPVSFGIVPTEGGATAPRVHVLFYRLSETGSDGLPTGDALIEATATLPPVGSGVETVAIPLSMQCFGVLADVPGHRTCDPGTGQLGPEPVLGVASASSLASLPSPAQPQPCSAAAPAGMACLPGNVFVLGSDDYADLSISGADVVTPEHLVRVSPFAIDLNEVTVGVVRQMVLTQGLTAPLTGDPVGLMPPECTYLGDDDPSNDAYPANCLPWDTATRACQLMGKRLPTEAEWEYAAGNAGLRTSFPWGGDTNICAYAVISDGRVQSEPTECLAGDVPPGPRASSPGGAVLDATSLHVLDMAGSVSEWTGDVFQLYTGSCWATGAGVLTNPSCAPTANPAGPHTIRGGSWGDSTKSAYIYARQATEDAASTYTGFRCAVSL